MTSFKVFLLSFVSMAMIACSDDEATINALSNVGDSTSTATKNSATLAWTEPTTNVDGSILAPGDIVLYRIYMSLDPSELTSYIEIDAAANPNSYIINYEENLVPNDTDIFIAMTAVNNQGVESNFSEVINFNTQ